MKLCFHQVLIEGRDKPVCMIRRCASLCAFFFFFAIAMSAPALAGEPTEKIKRTWDRFISIAGNPALMTPDRALERCRYIREALNELFDWEEISRRSLARHWGRRTAQEREKFIELLARRLERTCVRTLEEYPLVEVHYLGETIDRDSGLVKVKFVTEKEREIPFTYRLKKKGDDWLVYDISVEGISLVNSYRTQFNTFLVRCSYHELVKKLRAIL
jgi:phospholipid transport system substrate-binding protein